MRRANEDYLGVADFVKFQVAAPGRNCISFVEMGSLKKRRKAKINRHKRRKKLRLNRHKKRTWQA
jgi:hypothetical protein